MKQKVHYPVGAPRPAELPSEPTFGIGTQRQVVSASPTPSDLPGEPLPNGPNGFVNQVRELAFKMYMDDLAQR